MNWLISLFKHTPKIIIICGPTATGKTALSIDLAKKFNAEIISADSRQIYKGLDVGTAKITNKEMKGVPHHMIDIESPINIFSVQQYVSLGTKKINNILSRGNNVIICGGSGMYIDSLINGTQFPTVPPNHELRKKFEQKSPPELYSLLQKKDPRRAKTIDPHNPVRLIRALEVIEALGVVPKIKKKPKYNTLYIGLDIPKKDLNERIKKRIIDRLENENMLQETIDLYSKGLSYERMENLGLEYRYMARHLQGVISYNKMVSELLNKTIQFAKRQRTWFKRNEQIHWFNGLDDNRNIIELVSHFLNFKSR